MTTDFRALCAELVDLLDCFGSTFNIPIETSVVARARAALAEQPVGPTDDQIDELWDKEAGYYELYEEVRNVVRAVLAEWGYPTPIPVAERLPVELSDEELWAIWNPHDGPIPAVLRAAIAADRAANALPVPEAQ
jgi:hypothetical protein